MRHPTPGDLRTLAGEVGGVLVEKRETVATAESCTAGLVSATLTRVPGSSDFFWGGIVVYGADAKVELAGLDPELLEEHGTVSATTTEALAETIRDRSRATYGVAVTGWAGPTAGEGEAVTGCAGRIAGPGEAVGRVFVAVADRRGVVSRRWDFDGDRDAVRAAAAGAVLDLLRQRLAGSDDGADD